MHMQMVKVHYKNHVIQHVYIHLMSGLAVRITPDEWLCGKDYA